MAPFICVGLRGRHCCLSSGHIPGCTTIAVDLAVVSLIKLLLMILISVDWTLIGCVRYILVVLVAQNRLL